MDMLPSIHQKYYVCVVNCVCSRISSVISLVMFVRDLSNNAVTPLVCQCQVMGLNPGIDSLVHRCIFAEISGNHHLIYGVCALSTVLLRD